MCSTMSTSGAARSCSDEHRQPRHAKEPPMLSGEKILVTGPAGQIAAPLCRFLAEHNDVWGIARFSAPGSREEVKSMGVTPRVVDLADGDFSEVPDDFTY